MQRLRNGIETDRQPSVDRLGLNASLLESLWSVVNEHFLMLTVQTTKRNRLSSLDKQHRTRRLQALEDAVSGSNLHSPLRHFHSCWRNHSAICHLNAL